ncbi:hypothetical protein ACCAA_510001 [Candidatus Accumulibacter aalborgensis]|uniref:Hemolysin-type calcium-binding region n=1 Tax=Candidatus Accumulibacter aalborgensis TaxID=1860102 RepID=A0A1A8XS50_9PROT|nr:hypothetical protein [Candidatus Accumulibacter aalborgensis]SBT07939.1 hypothetical protein ACCAA_510001 [Candidatus Accumulibacter aalborgensis]
MPVISLDIIGQRDGQVFYPTTQQVSKLQTAISNSELAVLSSTFPDQLGFVSHVDSTTGLNQYDIAMQAVHDGFPGYIIVAADQSAYPMAVYGTNLGNGISVLADIRIVELALDESIQDAMDKALTAAIQSSLGSDYPDLNINVASTMITGNVDISLPGTKNVTGGPVDGVISAMARTSADGSQNISFHDFLWSQILAATDAKGLNLHLENQLNNIDGLRGGAGNDVLDGSNSGDYLLSGNAGNDIIIGGGYSDIGINVIEGGLGNDSLVAGGHKTGQFDKFLAANPSIAANAAKAQSSDLNSIMNSVADNSTGRSYNIFTFDSNSGSDAIYNFHAATDQIQIHKGINNSNIVDLSSLVQHITVSGDNLSIDLGGNNIVTLLGVDVAGLSAVNASFV